MNILNTSMKIGNLELKNRLVMPPMATGKASSAGEITQQHLEFYNEKSMGGYIALFITEHSYVNIEGKATKGQLSISSDSDISGLAQLADIIHKNGSKVMAQISHAGGVAKSAITGQTAKAPSAVKMPGKDWIPEAMTITDIQQVVADFAAAAVRVKKAGFDGVEIHSAHGYLLNQFYSPLTNKRTDQYGGAELADRLRIHIEIIRAIRELVGQEYPVAIRLGACDYMEGGTTLKDSLTAVQLLERAGIDLLDISGGLCGSVRPGAKEEGYFRELTQSIKKEVSIPVLLTGGITNPDTANALLKEKKADCIGVGRAIFKDSLWAKRAIQ